MAVPTVEECTAYLGPNTTWDETAISSAFEAEFAAQSRVCVHPAVVLDGETDVTVWPKDLREALFRRVAHNLALRALPLGVQASFSDAAVQTTRVGGTDAEVRRLEGPWRKLVAG